MIKFFPDRSTILSVFGVSIQWYAVLIITGAFITLWFSKKDLRKARYIERDGFLDDFFVFALWSGVIGARLWFCLFYNPSFYLSHPLEILKIWEGGLAIHGGLFGGALFAYFYCKKKNVSFFRLADAVVPNILLAQAMGRWGNFANQECHGPEVAESFYDGILSFLKEGMHIGGHYYEPEFFYESLLCVLGWLIIHFFVSKTMKKRGGMMSAYMMWYGIVRAFIEMRRTDSLMLGPFKIAVIISLCFVVLGIFGSLGGFEKLLKKRKPTLIFDFDGTLMDTDKSIVEAYREMFRARGREQEFTPDRETEVLGPPLRELFPHYFPEEDVETLVDEYRKINRKLSDEYSVPCPYAKEVLEQFSKAGYDIGIVSTKQKSAITDLLKKFGMDPYVKDVIGIEEVTKTKPDPEGLFTIVKKNRWNADDLIFIGDSAGDIGMGQNYGAYTVVYTANPAKKEKLLTLGANRDTDDLRDLLSIAEEDHHFTFDER